MATSLLEVVLVACILILPICYEYSKVFRYYFKFIVYYGWVMAASLLVIPVMVCRPRNVKNLLLASKVCHQISSLLGLEWELKGGEYLAVDKAFIIVSNHQSSLDILALFELWPIMQKCTVVAKKELFYAWPFGLAAWLCGLIFIDRLHSESARCAINSSLQKLKIEKTKLWVFPEGTRKNTGEIHLFKKGAFHAAISAQLPVLPVVFTEFYFLQSKDKQLDPGRVMITVLPPINTTGLTPDDLSSLMAKTRAIMIKTFQSTTRLLRLQVQQSRDYR